MDVDVARVESCNLLRWNACRINVCTSSSAIAERPRCRMG